MAVSDELLAILRCPENRTSLHRADEAQVDELNRKIAARELKNRGGQTVEDAMDGGLIRQDGALLYPIVDGIPKLLVDEAILLGQMG
jgi:uncharacterized protein YbaR (Trm112 family)